MLVPVRARAVLGAIASLLLLLATTAGVAASECVLHPVSFAAAIASSRFVALATVTDFPDGGTGRYVLHVDRALRGRAPMEIVVPQPYAGDFCQVAIGRPGTRVAIAMRDPTTLADGETFAWTIASNGRLVDDNLSGSVTDSPTTLGDLAARLDELPPTDTPPPTEATPAAVVLLAFAGIAGAAAIKLRMRRG